MKKIALSAIIAAVLTSAFSMSVFAANDLLIVNERKQEVVNYKQGDVLIINDRKVATVTDNTLGYINKTRVATNVTSTLGYMNNERVVTNTTSTLGYINNDRVVTNTVSTLGYANMIRNATTSANLTLDVNNLSRNVASKGGYKIYITEKGTEPVYFVDERSN